MRWLTCHIGGQRWRVELVSASNPNLLHDGERCHGVCLFDKCRIYISRDLDEQAREDTLLHELLHAALLVSGARNALREAVAEVDRYEAVEEGTVRALTPVLHRLLKDLGFRFPKQKENSK